MAAPHTSTQVRTQAEALHKLEEHLTCSICLEQYTNPKILPCFHSFCLHCLRGVLPELTKQGNHSLSCPTCRSLCQLPQQGVNGFPPSFTINNLTEVYDLMKKVLGKGHTSCDKCQKQDANRYCKQCGKFLCQQCLQLHNGWITNHETLGLNEVANTAYQLPQFQPEVTSDCPDHDKPLEIFCETCEELICQLCTVKKHKDHDYDVVKDAYTKNKLIIQQSSLQPLNERINVIAEAIANLIGRRTEIAEQGEKTKAATHEAIAQIKELLDETERLLNKKVDGVMDYKLTITDQQTKEAKVVLGQLTECRDHIQQSLAVDTPHQVLSTKAQMVSRTESLLAGIKGKTFQPLEQANLRLVRNDKQSIEDIPSYVGTIKYTTPTVTTSFDHTPIVGQESTINMLLSLEDGSPAPYPSSLISCHLIPPPTSYSSPVQCTVKRTSRTGQYSVVFIPRTRGSHQLYVKLHNRTIPGNPVSIPVTVPVQSRGQDHYRGE